jgi:outer membrane biosynthesis protein TonB
MGSFVVYVLEWALCLSAFLLLYKMCFSGSTFHRFNRFFLLGSVVVSAMLPLIHITTNNQIEPIAEVCRVSTEQIELLPAVQAEGLQRLEALPTSVFTIQQKIFVILTLTYLIYIAIQAIGWLRSLVKMLLFLRGKRSRRVGRWIRLVVHSEEYGPFSWMNCIVISDKENGFGRRASMHHELSHIRLLHPLDLVFILLCTIVNPVCWLVMKEIKVVHEYEADDRVINYYHIQSRDYQRLLIQRTVGAEAYALACSFNLNIKKRIIMMKKKQSTWWRMTWIAVTLPLVGIALTAFSKPKEALKEAVDNSVEIMHNAQFTIHTPKEAELAVEEAPAPAPVKEVKADNDVKPGDKITGCVRDKNGQPLQYVNLVEIDEYGRFVALTLTDKNGNYALKVVNPKHKIRFSYVGLKSQTLDISSAKCDVVMEEGMKFTSVEVVSRHDSISSSDLRYKDQDITNGDQTFNLVEQNPTYPGGQGEIMKYLSTHLRYPAVASEMQVEGEITVKFIVDKTGFVRSPQVVEVSSKTPLITAEIAKAAKEGDEEAVELSKNYYDAVEALKEEAIHVVRNMPRWEPGRQNGKRVETTFTLPVSFNLAKQ